VYQEELTPEPYELNFYMRLGMEWNIAEMITTASFSVTDPTDQILSDSAA
jgi:hypothetical protein